ncbi:MAG: NAD(P)/FAD-dependent oxidoreductase [Rhodospirillaceae bacterium]
MRVCETPMSTLHVLTPHILIVGAGIAGATIAAGLRGRGYSVVQLEASNQPLDTARGDHLGPRVVETLAEWNILDAFFAAGAEKRLGAKWLLPNGDLVLHSRMDDLPLPHPYYIVLNHDLIATTALDLALHDARYDYTLFRPVAARQIVAGPDAHGGVSEVHISAPDGTPRGRSVTIRPQMTIACDGRSSKVRSACGFGIAKTYDYEKMFVVLFGPRGELQDPRNELYSYMSRYGGVSRIPRMNGQWKVGLSITKDEIARWKTTTSEQRKALLAARAPVLGDLETEVAGFYPVIRRETADWAKGTTVLVGDACHTIHPTRGQGMNFGVRCAAQLFDYLPDPADMADAALVTRQLKAYEAAVKPLTDAQLEDNHQSGLYADSAGPERLEAEVPALRAIAADPDAYFRYRMTMAGYPDRLPPV